MGGNTVLMEYSIFLNVKRKNEYLFKNYCAPNWQVNIEEAKGIQNFLNELYKICDSENLSNVFIKEIPFRSYSYNSGSSVLIRVMKIEENRKKKNVKEKK